MTPYQINAKIGELCGWTKHVVDRTDKFTCTNCGAQYARGLWSEWGVTNQWCAKDTQTSPPNYHGSLDACAEFEATLNSHPPEKGGEYSDYTKYCIALEQICQALPYCATAPQRCAAFLKIHGIDV